MTFIVPQPGETFDQGRINTLFEGTGDVAVRRRQIREGDPVPAIEVIREWRTERYEYTRWREYDNGSFTTTILDHRGWLAPFKSIAWDDPAVDYPSGVVPTAVAEPYAWNGDYGTSTVTGRNVEVVLPVNTTRIGMGGTVQGNSALLMVTLNGDATLANLLPTAQDLVTRGTAASTILVANGGPFQPTDRVLDTYHGAQVTGSVGGTDSYFDHHFPIADNLDEDTAWTIRIQHSGQKNLAASGTATFNIGRFTYGDDSMTRNDTGVDLLDLHRALFNIIPDTEYALDVQPAGASTEALVGGQAHGYENCTNSAITYTVDGVTVPTSGTAGAPGNLNLNPPTVMASAWNWGAEVVVTRPSTLYHPTLAAGATPWADSFTTFTTTYEGLRFKPEIELLLNAAFDEHYLSMYSLDGYRFTAGWWYEDLDPSLFTARDDSITYKTASGAMFYDPDGVQAANWELSTPADLGILSAAPSMSTGAPNSDIVKGYRRSPAISLLAGDVLTTETLLRLSLESAEVTVPLFVSSREELELDGLALNDGTTFCLLAVDFTPPKQRQEWIGAADSEHQVLVRNPLHENRTITATIQVIPSATMDAALDGVARIVDRLQAASKDQDGVQLVWSPTNSSLAVTFDVLAGEVTAMPIDDDNGWMLAMAPTVTITMTAKPYWRSTVELSTDIVESTDPFVTLEIENNLGDIPALGRLVVYDAEGKARRHVEWGLEGPRTYDPATSLLIDSDDMETSGFAGTSGALAGSYGGNAISMSTLGAQAMAGVSGTHTGSFRVKGRFLASTLTPDQTAYRLAWRDQDGPLATNPPAQPVVAIGWTEVDLGTITVTGNWSGIVQADSPVITETAYVDYLILEPVTDGYGKARATYSYKPGVISALDEFSSTTAGNNLNGRVSPIGAQTWATSGTAADFTFEDFSGGEVLKTPVPSISDSRFAILGTTVRTDTEVGLKMYRNTLDATWGGGHESGVIARWTDSSNYLSAKISATPGLWVSKVIAGTRTNLLVLPLSSADILNSWVTLKLVVHASGVVFAQVSSAAGGVLASGVANDPDLASGGTLDDGKVGLVDINSANLVGFIARLDGVYAGLPADEPIVVHPNRSLTVNGVTVFRENSTGTLNGRPQSYRGSRFTVPVGTSRAFVKARRNDVETSYDDTIDDATRAQVFWTSRGLVVPR